VCEDVVDSSDKKESGQDVTCIMFKRGQPEDLALNQYLVPKTLGVALDRNQQVYGYLSASLILK
jgi:hypothetical protein